jgi:hypothetical protein
MMAEGALTVFSSTSPQVGIWTVQLLPVGIETARSKSERAGRVRNERKILLLTTAAQSHDVTLVDLAQGNPVKSSGNFEGGRPTLGS